MKIKSNWIIKSVALLCALLMTLGLFAGCNAECKHTYVNGVCTACKDVCSHKSYENGVCIVCGIACEHDYNKKGECKTCGIKCTHEEYDEGECVECGLVCAHEEYENGECTVCGYVCAHLFGSDSVCVICKIKCTHDKGYEGGVCKVCKANCKHDYKNGVCQICKSECKHENFENNVCKVCGLICTHEKYNDKGFCEVCGKACIHDYENGVCKICKLKCNHKNFENEHCLDCGIVCSHEKYNNKGFCESCGRECDHSYNNAGECEVCGTNKFPTVNLPNEQSSLPRVSVVTENLSFPDATEYVPSYDNEHPENNKDWQYSDCLVTVDNCDEDYVLAQTGGFKVRGNWTTTYPKKPFRIKFDKKQNMLGLNKGEKFKSWVLLADYKDFSLERNSVALYLGNQIFGEDGYYCSDFQQVELYLNGQYWGVYLLVEQQQTNKKRINVTEPEDGYTGTDIGYFLEYDGYYNLEKYNERFSLNYGEFGQLRTKNGGSVTPDQVGFTIKSDVYENEAYAEGDPLRYPQKNFIKGYMYNLYKICYNAVYNGVYYAFNQDFTGTVTYVPTTDNPVKETVSKVIDIQSLVDMYIHCEIVCDYDLYWSSFLMDVDFGPTAKDNLLRFEAPWDFDSAFGLRYACESGVGLYAANVNNPWILIFINEDWFQDMVKAKWQKMKNANVQQNALDMIYELREANAAVYQKNFNKWGFWVTGEATWDIQQNVRTHEDAANQLHDWLSTRFSYLDTQWL